MLQADNKVSSALEKEILKIAFPEKKKDEKKKADK